MTSILHLTHIGDIAMLAQAKGKIFWPNLRRDPRKTYEECKVCSENRTTKASEHNKVSYENMFRNFMPGQQFELDYTIRSNQNHWLIACSITCYIQDYKISNKSTAEAIKG